eukprot:763311-Hanusia_phi.AAC.1
MVTYRYVVGQAVLASKRAEGGSTRGREEDEEEEEDEDEDEDEDRVERGEERRRGRGASRTSRDSCVWERKGTGVVVKHAMSAPRPLDFSIAAGHIGAPRKKDPPKANLEENNRPSSTRVDPGVDECRVTIAGTGISFVSSIHSSMYDLHQKIAQQRDCGQSHQKVCANGSILSQATCSDGEMEAQAEARSRTLQSYGLTGGSKVLAFCTKVSLQEEMKRAAEESSKFNGVRSFAQEEELMRRRANAAPMFAKKASGSLADFRFGFGRCVPLQVDPNTGRRYSSPPPPAAEELLKRLASDRNTAGGFRPCRRFLPASRQVVGPFFPSSLHPLSPLSGILTLSLIAASVLHTSLHPPPSSLLPPPCLFPACPIPFFCSLSQSQCPFVRVSQLGLNKNKGEEILLRLRTSDLKGFRPYYRLSRYERERIGRGEEGERRASARVRLGERTHQGDSRTRVDPYGSLGARRQVLVALPRAHGGVKGAGLDADEVSCATPSLLLSSHSISRGQQAGGPARKEDVEGAAVREAGQRLGGEDEMVSEERRRGWFERGGDMMEMGQPAQVLAAAAASERMEGLKLHEAQQPSELKLTGTEDAGKQEGNGCEWRDDLSVHADLTAEEVVEERGTQQESGSEDEEMGEATDPLEELQMLGFSAEQAQLALAKFHGSLVRAADWLLAGSWEEETSQVSPATSVAQADQWKEGPDEFQDLRERVGNTVQR